MKSIIITIIVLCLSSYLYSQSSMIYETGTNIQVETGADICADNIIIEGTYSGGGTKCDAPLPVEIISFSYSVSANGRDITLIWLTEKEINNSGFNVERKAFGMNEWIKISFVAGKGNSETPVQYSYEDKKLNSGKYNYRLKQIDYNGNFEYFELNKDVEIAAPKKFELSQNYPNPFNPVTKIDYDLPVDVYVSIKIYDVTGREIKTLVNENQKTGYNTMEFNASYLSSGVYFYKIQVRRGGSLTNDFSETKRMILLK